MTPRRAAWATTAVAVALTACSGAGHPQTAAPPATVVTPPPTPSTAGLPLANTSTPSTAAATSAAAAAAAAAGPGRSVRTTTTTRRSVTTTTLAAPGGATIAGCPLFPADNAWRRDISHDPLDPRSSAWVASAGVANHLHPDFGSNPSYGIPYVVVPASQSQVPITFTAYGDQSDPGPYPVPATAPIEAGSDAHVLVASGNCHLYEMYGASPNGRGGWNAASGAVFDLQSDRLRPDSWTSADAAGLPILPGLVRWDEIQAGHIDHALRFTVSRTQKGFIHPATHQAGSTTDPNVPPMGARFRLKASFDLSGYHGAALVVLQALQRYGMFLADNGSNWYLSGATDARWNDIDLNQLRSIPGSAFEAVASGTVQH
jgi:hypothetical protein